MRRRKSTATAAERYAGTGYTETPALVSALDTAGYRNITTSFITTSKFTVDPRASLGLPDGRSPRFWFLPLTRFCLCGSGLYKAVLPALLWLSAQLLGLFYL